MRLRRARASGRQYHIRRQQVAPQFSATASVSCTWVCHRSPGTFRQRERRLRKWPVRSAQAPRVCSWPTPGSLSSEIFLPACPKSSTMRKSFPKASIGKGLGAGFAPRHSVSLLVDRHASLGTGAVSSFLLRCGVRFRGNDFRNLRNAAASA